MFCFVVVTACLKQENSACSMQSRVRAQECGRRMTEEHLNVTLTKLHDI